jgi:SAM-dependent methyltransferase
MPDLDTSLHVDMLKHSRRERYLPFRLLRAISREFRYGGLYGLEWGDPEVVEPLRFIRDRFVLPYIRRDQKAVEIGPGGGRWTRYLQHFGTLYAVDFYEPVLEELRRHFRRRRNIKFLKNNGTDFPGVTPQSIDFVFSFGTFVHLDFHLIGAYLDQIRVIIKPGSNVVIHYADKTKIMGKLNAGFSENTPERMREAVTSRGYRILEEDTTTMWHSSIIRFAV